MRVRSPARGQDILNAAARLFGARHYHEVRMEDIAAAAGVAKGTIYGYYEDKEDLYLGLILSGLEALYQDVQKGIAAARTPKDKLLFYVRASINFFRHQPYFLELVQRIELSGHKTKIALLEECRGRFFRLVANMIAACQPHDQGRTGPGKKKDLTLAALALTGMIRQILRFHPRPFAKDLPGWIVRQFLEGLTNGNAEKVVRKMHASPNGAKVNSLGRKPQE